MPKDIRVSFVCNSTLSITLFLQAKEAQIRKQYRQALKTQQLQYKILEKQMASQLNRDELRELVGMHMKDD